MFHIVYFTCGKHWERLLMSLESWRNLSSLEGLAGVELNVDCNDLPGAREIEAARARCPLPITITPTAERMAHSGVSVVLNEIRTYFRIAGVAQPEDWIVKVDSDVLITSSRRAFEQVSDSRAALIGNPMGPFVQGGVYFLRCGEIHRLGATSLRRNRFIQSNPAHCPEDRAITEQMWNGRGRVEHTQIVWNRPHVAKLRGRPPGCTFLHFLGKTKHRMPRSAWLLSSARAREQFLSQCRAELAGDGGGEPAGALPQCCILFLHREADAITRRHYELLVERNPGIPVAPIHHGGAECAGLDGAVPVAGQIPGLPGDNRDWIVREWFRGPHRIEARRYIALEWNCYADTSLAEWYREVWDCDAAGARVRAPERPPHESRRETWRWFRRQRRRMPEEIHEHATGLSPFNGVLLSRRALDFYSRVPEWYGGLGLCAELRLPSILKAARFHIQAMPRWKARRNTCGARYPMRVIAASPGLWHPVDKHPCRPLPEE